uniref:Uncharacterized protein n=1 Tax=Rhizophora mucronata TaxID=61149 RepID=A0A2P2NFE9_RHIMU
MRETALKINVGLTLNFHFHMHNFKKIKWNFGLYYAPCWVVEGVQLKKNLEETSYCSKFIYV